MGAIMPAASVPTPPVGPLRYGLFRAARAIQEDAPTQAALGGVQFEPAACGGAHRYSAACPPSSQLTKIIDPSADTIRTQPFWAYASEVCAPVGRDLTEQRRLAVQRLLGGEQTQVEAAFWDGGGVGASPSLTTMGATVVVSPLTSFGGRLSALLTAFRAAYGYQGTLHANTALEGAAAFGNMIIRPDTPDIPAHLVTPTGEIWSFGDGYGITGPGGVAPAAGSAWVFITAPVTIWRDAEISVQDPAQTFDRSTNQAYVIAERAYNVAPDCLTAFAIELPLEAA